MLASSQSCPNLTLNMELGHTQALMAPTLLHLPLQVVGNAAKPVKQVGLL
jgi:hypothetical protein